MTPAVLVETHSHTRLCKHALGEPTDYAAAAHRRGWDGLIVTCHNPMPDGFSRQARMELAEFPEYLRLVFQARHDWLGRVDVRLGLECDYFPGYEGWVEQQLQTADFQYVLGSVHPQISEFEARYWDGDAVAFQRTYFRSLAEAAETGLFDCLSHPDLVKNTTYDRWRPEVVMDDIRRALDRIAATGVSLELNTSGVQKDIAEMNPFPQMLVEMKQRGIHVVIGGDAHEPSRVGDGFPEALDLLEQCGYQQISLYLDRVRQEVPIAAARAALAGRVGSSPSPQPSRSRLPDGT